MAEGGHGLVNGSTGKRSLTKMNAGLKTYSPDDQARFKAS